MADYIQKSLAPGEVLVARGRWPWVMWLKAWAVLLFLGVFIVGIFWFLQLCIRYITTRWAVTNRRVIVKRGWLTRSTEELNLENLEAVSVQQSVWGRLFDYGEVVVTGAGEASLAVPATASPIAFRRAIEAARHAASTQTVTTEAAAERAEERARAAGAKV